MIKVEGLVKHYGDKYAVNNISFTVGDREIVGFLGPNGAGKSTTMNILTGYLSATDGKVEINGHDILEDTMEAKKSIGHPFAIISSSIACSATALWGQGCFWFIHDV